MSKASLELGGGNWAAKDGKLLGYAVGDTSGKYLPREFTFSRGADIGATRVNKDGLIEKYRENLIKSSNDFTATGWTSANSTVLSGYSGYDGTNDAWFLRADSGLHSRVAMDNTTSTGLSSTGLRTFSVYAKKKDYDYVGMYIQGSNKGVVFSLLDGTVVNSLISYPDIYSDGIEVGGGWWRFSISHLITTSTTAAAVYACESTVYNGNSNHGKGIYIQDAQFEYGLVATDYIESGSSTGKAGVLDNLPRIDYTSGSAQLLMEPSRTNLVSNSEGIIAGSNAVTTTLNYGVAPDGTTSSLKVQKNGSSENDRIIVADDLAVLNASTYTVSGFVKNIDIVDTGVTTIAARMDTTNTLFRKGYEWTGSSLASTSYGDSGSTSNTILEDYGNGWWRIGFTFTTDSTQLDFEIDVDRRNEYDTTSIETWGWQLEEGGYATSYIPNYGTALGVTRDKDVSSITGVSSLIGSTEGTIYLEVAALANDLSDRRFALSDGTTNNVARVGFTSVSNRIVAVLYNGTNQCVLTYDGADITETNKIAFTYAANDFALYVNGESRSTDVSGVTFSAGTLSEIRFNEGDGSGNESYGKFDKVMIFPTRLTNNELAALTA